MKTNISIYLSIISFLFVISSCKKDEPEIYDPGTITDIEGNIYKTVKIGNQIWMAENLRTTRFNDSTNIPMYINDYDWMFIGGNGSPTYTWYNNDKDSYDTTYGALYNWYAVNTGNLCPKGWHIPSNSEWGILINNLGNDLSSFQNEFKALAGGGRYYGGSFYLNTVGNWWSSSVSDIEGCALCLTIKYENQQIGRYDDPKAYGYSVRCVKD